MHASGCILCMLALLRALPCMQLPEQARCAAGGKDGGGGKGSWFDWYFQNRKAPPPQALARTTPMRIEPKTFFGECLRPVHCQQPNAVGPSCS